MKIRNLILTVGLGYDLGESCQRIQARMLCIDFFATCIFSSHEIKNYSTITAKLILLKNTRKKFQLKYESQVNCKEWLYSLFVTDSVYIKFNNVKWYISSPL